MQRLHDDRYRIFYLKIFNLLMSTCSLSTVSEYFCEILKLKDILLYVDDWDAGHSYSAKYNKN